MLPHVIDQSIKISIPYDQAIQMKRICSNEAGLQRKLVYLESWLADGDYKF